MPHSENPKKVLIVDDEAGVSKPLAMRFKKMGLEVHVAIDGVEGLETARRIIPDFIILDLYLPRLSGEEVCKALREDDDERLTSIPIVMLTAKDMLVDKIIGKVIGANAYLTKPCEFEDLLREIKRLNLLDD